MPTRVIADIHGDRPRRRGSTDRRGGRLLAPLADALARYGLRHSDGVRTISAYTSSVVREAGVEPTAEFAGVHGPRAVRRVERRFRCPSGRVALFVGVLERYKAVDVLAEAWRLAAPRVPEARLHLVGRGAAARDGVGTRRATCPRRLAGRSRSRLQRLLGRSTMRRCSCSRRAPRAWAASSWRRSAAAAAVVGSRVGGIPDIVEDGVTGILVEPGDAASSRRRARPRARPTARLPSGSERRRTPRVQPWLATPEEYARRIRELVDEVTA